LEGNDGVSFQVVIDLVLNRPLLTITLFVADQKNPKIQMKNESRVMRRRRNPFVRSVKN